MAHEFTDYYSDTIPMESMCELIYLLNRENSRKQITKRNKKNEWVHYVLREWCKQFQKTCGIITNLEEEATICCITVMWSMWLSYATYATICSFNLCLYQASKRCLLKPNKTATNFQENYKILLWKKQELSGKYMPTFSTCLLTDYVKIANRSVHEESGAAESRQLFCELNEHMA